MEIALAALLAGTLFFATWAFTARNNERARAHRLAEELEALRKPSHIPTVESDRGLVLHPGEIPEPESVHSASEPVAASGDAELLRLARSSIAQALVDLELLHGPGAALAGGAEPLPSPLLESLKQDVRTFLSAEEAVETSISTLLLRTAPFRAAAPAAAEPPPEALPREAPPERSEEELISDASAAIEELSDPTSRMADDLGSVLRNAERIRSSAIQSGAALATVSRSADSLTPLASALSSLSNRINLLALNLAVLVNPGARDSGEFDKAGDELRGLFEETRRLSREVGSLSQRAAGAARSARETSEDVVAAATDGHARAERGLQELAHLEELTVHLKQDLEETRRSSRRATELRLQLLRELATAEAAESARASHVRGLGRDAQRWVKALDEIATAFHDTRTSGERTVRSLLQACEPGALPERPGAAAGTRCITLLREASVLLERLTAARDTEQTSRHN